MELKVIIESVITLFIIILVGFYGSKKKIISADLNKGLTNILIQITLPFMILSAFNYTYDETIKYNVIKTFYYSAFAYIVIIPLSYVLLSPIKKDKKTILHFANVFTNTGYVGFPILFSIYGAEGIVYGSIFHIFFVTLLWTYGIILFSGSLQKNEFKAQLKQMLLNPSIIAVCLGILFMVFDIQLSGPLHSSITAIGGISGPLSMIIIGVVLANCKLKTYLRDWTMYYGVAIKLILIPAFLYFIAWMAKESSVAINTVIIMSAMPASAMTSILAENYNKERSYAAVFVSITTLLSLVTIPLLLNILI